MSEPGIQTEILLDYQNSISSQSSNKIKQKKVVQIEKGMNISNGFKMSQVSTSSVKNDKFRSIYGKRNNKVKRSLTNQKSASMKVGENRFNSAKSKCLNMWN